MSTVLVVDDEEDIRHLVARMLRHGGFDVVEAGSGEQASEVYADHGAIDVVVTDVILDGETGTELGARLQESAPDLKVLYISGCPDVHYVKTSERAAFLSKPFTIAEIVDSVSDLLMR
jgi:DNA-binding NtrC family response regulator